MIDKTGSLEIKQTIKLKLARLQLLEMNTFQLYNELMVPTGIGRIPYKIGLNFSGLTAELD